MSKEHEDTGFKVTDKRLFDEDGSPREGTAQETPANQQEPTKDSSMGEQPSTSAEAPPGIAGPIDFPSYVLSYYTQGLVLLGEVPNPYTNKKEEDLQAARHTVDILGMLKDKTKGNLTTDEEQLLESVLYEVRIKYMAKIKQIKLS